MSIVVGNVVTATSAVILYKNNTGAPNNLIVTTHGNSADIYVGGSTVTSTGNGIVVPKSSHLEFVVPAGEKLYCAGNGTDTIRYMSFV